MSIKVSIINIGNELLLGRTVNTNLSWLACHLTDMGMLVHRSVTVRDKAIEIKKAIRQEWNNSDVVFITGGLGPTKDDITKRVLCDVFDTELIFNDTVWGEVQNRFLSRNLVVPEINRSQAMVPSGFIALKNQWGTAPGLYLQQNGKSLFALPGVPLELQVIFQNNIEGIIRKQYALSSLYIHNIHTWKISESALAEKLSELKVPKSVQLAWLPQTGRVDLRIYGNDSDRINITKVKLTELIADYIWGENQDTPQSVLHKILSDKNLTIAIAESCTGGLVQQIITSEPGASRIFLGGIVAYSNNTKKNILKVKTETLNKFGAVSEETAQEMAIGIQHIMGSDIGMSITGIAGPEGSSAVKPLGTVYLGIVIGNEFFTTKQIFSGNRETIRIKASEYLILSLIELLRS